MKYFLDGKEVTAKELEKEKDNWEYHGSMGHQVITLNEIDNEGMYFYKSEWEC